MTDINNLYMKNPEIYDAFSNDRDFLKQSQSLLLFANLENSNISIIELFAGPARHSAAFRKLGYNTYSLDSSESMKEYAVKKGFQDKERYIVGHLPSSEIFKEKNRQLSVFTILRFSIGYLNKMDVRKVISWCKGHASKGAILVIELHKPSIISAAMNELSICQREFETEIGSVKCRWPSRSPTWSDTNWEVSMPVEIEVESKQYEYTSTETIHSFKDISDLANSCNCHTELVTKSIAGFNSDSLLAVVYL
ncbi:Glycine N-methyltransferase [Moritella sp. JT01]|uniref:hypothetical protein n=1 Tax=Moritella sp. JT01 TaxID=756698 RepID=UPI0007984790|nr:hypothetical protein [Moritella sp. JT01]KXO11552.1 Glycine N-methyltransferase [Moritella sp. JT01]